MPWWGAFGASPVERNPETGAARSAWIDVARGLGIILVVWAHVIRAHLDLEKVAWAGDQNRWIYSFHMPLFFFLGGMFLWASIGRGRLSFLKGRWGAIIWPYLLWSFITGSIELGLSNYVNSPISVREVLRIPIEPIEQYWFLYVLLGCQLLCVCAYPYRVALWPIATLGLALLISVGSPWVGLRTFMYLPFVIAGIYLSSWLRDRASGRQSSNWALAVCGLVLLILTFALPPLPEGVTFFAQGLAGSIMCVGLAMLFARTGRPSQILAALGRASLAIFVMHTLFSAGVRISLNLVGIAPDSALSLASATAAGIVAPWVVLTIVKGQGWERRLGLGA